MPKKKNDEPQEKQSKRFLKAVADLEAAGELNPTEADERFEKAVGKILPPSIPKDEWKESQ
jgi:guanylate kinase